MSWKSYSLGEILKRRKTIEKIYPDKDYKLVTIKLYHKGVVLRNIAKGETIKSTMSSVKSGDFVLSGIDARNGAFGIVPDELEGAVITNDFWCLVPDKDVIDKEFLLYLTSTDFFDHICKQSSDGTTQRIRLQKDKFFHYRIELPSIHEQKKILSNLKLFENNKVVLSTELTHQLDLVKQLRQAFLREAMQGRLVSQNPADGSAADLLRRIKAEKQKLIANKKLKKEKELPPIKPEEIPFDIPDNWVWCKLGEMFDIERGSSPRPKGDPRYFSKKRTKHHWIKISDITSFSKQGILYDTNEFLTDEGSKYGRYVSQQDLIVAVSGSVGKTTMLNIEGYIYDGFLAVKNIKDSTMKQFLYNIFRVYEAALLSQATGAIWQNINTDIARLQLIPLPPLSEQERIVEKLDELMGLCDELEQSIRQSRDQSDMLLRQVLREALQEPIVVA